MIRLTVPFIDDEEIEAVIKVLKSGHLVQGEEVKKFEKTVSDYLGVKYAVAVSSGTAALHVALAACGVSAGDEIIIPAFTYPATANVVELLGAKPVFVDIDSHSYNINPRLIEAKITKRTKAIMPVHLFGQAAAMDAVLSLARKYKLLVIEDAACALGARYKKRLCATMGDIGCISFHPRKNITTAEGGMIVTNNSTLAQKAKMLCNHGIKVHRQKTDFIFPGFNYRMTEMQAAIGIVQMKKLNHAISKRQNIARLYNNLFQGIDGLILPQEVQKGTHTFQTYVIKINQSGVKRDRLLYALRKKGIEASIATYAVPEAYFYKKKYHFKKNDFSCAHEAYRLCLALPIYPTLSEKHIRFIAATLKELYA